MKVFIPSINRAAQLRLLIESLRKNFADFDSLRLNVLYSAKSNSVFADGYEKLKKEQLCDGINFIKETDFCRQTKEFLYNNIDEYILFFVDDCIFYRPCAHSCDLITSLLNDKDWCFSFRLGLNTTEQYYVDGSQCEHLSKQGYEFFGYDYDFADQFIRWNWKIRPAQHNTGYAFSFDGHIYRARDIYEIIKDESFSNPRALESILVRPLTRQVCQRKNMLALSQNCVFSNAINCVSSTKIAAGVIYHYSAEELNERYLNGEVIDLDSLDCSSICGAHTEIDLKFKQES